MGLASKLAAFAARLTSDSKVPSTGLAAGAASGNLGFTPVDISNPVLGASTHAWHYLSTTKVDANAGLVRKSKQFTGNTAQVACKWKVNYGWGGGSVRIRLHEDGHIGNTYREIFVTAATGTALVANTYSPGYTNIQMLGGFGSYSIVGVQAGGGIDVGYYEVTLTVTPETYSNMVVDIEFWGLVETTTTPTKGQIQFL